MQTDLDRSRTILGEVISSSLSRSLVHGLTLFPLSRLLRRSFNDDTDDDVVLPTCTWLDNIVGAGDGGVELVLLLPDEFDVNDKPRNRVTNFMSKLSITFQTNNRFSLSRFFFLFYDQSFADNSLLLILYHLP